MFLYNIGADLAPTAENPGKPKCTSALAVWCSNTHTIAIERYSKAYVNIRWKYILFKRKKHHKDGNHEAEGEVV